MGEYEDCAYALQHLANDQRRVAYEGPWAARKDWIQLAVCRLEYSVGWLALGRGLLKSQKEQCPPAQIFRLGLGQPLGGPGANRHVN